MILGTGKQWPGVCS